jgi:hypothetical protein
MSSNGHCPHCQGGPELCREAEDAFCLICGFRLSYFAMREAKSTRLYDASREIAGVMALNIPLYQPGSTRHGFSVPATMSTGG